MPSPRMSCLALVTEAFGGTGGIAQFNRDFLRAVERSGFVESVVTLPRLGLGSAPPDYPRLRQVPPRFNRFGYSIGAVGAAIGQPVDVVISGHLYHGPLARRIADLKSARLVSVLHGTEIWKPVRKKHLYPLKGSDLVVCVSEDTKHRYLDQAGHEYEADVVVLPNTVDDRFTPGDRRAARARFGLDHLKVVLTVGRLDDRNGYKGHDRIIPVLARLKEQGRHVRYLIAGDGPDRLRLERLVSEAGLSDLVAFLGYVPHDSLPDLYRAVDLFALPSTGEGFGIVYLEAMACGTPAIGLDVGGAKEALEGLGVAVAEDDFEEALKRLLTSPALDRNYLANATTARFGKKIFAKKVQKILSNIHFK